MTRRRRLLPGERIRAERADARLEWDVKYLRNPENAAINFLASAEAVAIGEAVVRSCNDLSRTYTVVVADGSCQCLDSLDGICKHVEAASSFPGQALTVAKVKAGADFYRMHPEYVRQADATYDNSIRVVVPLAHADEGVRVEDAFLLYVNTVEQVCSCKLFAVHGACPHLLAVLEGEQSEALLATLEALEGDMPLHRRRRMNPLAILDEPTSNCDSELGILMSAPQRALAQRYKPSETMDLAKARCNDIAAVMKQLPLEQQNIGLLKIEGLLEELANQVPHFQRTHVATQKVANRKNKRDVPADRRKMVPLQPMRGIGKRKREQAAVETRNTRAKTAIEEKKRFVAAKQAGTASSRRVVTKQSNRKKLRTK